jgi:hypothetical protein
MLCSESSGNGVRRLCVHVRGSGLGCCGGAYQRREAVEGEEGEGRELSSRESR